jgi:thiol:disulfide interchange protein DsbD
MPGYFLYHDRIQLTGPHPIFKTPGLVLPAPDYKTNAQGKRTPIYRHQLIIPLNIQGLEPGEVLLKLKSQGCSDAGYCYPPQTHTLLIRIDSSLNLAAAELFTTTHSSLFTHPFQTHGFISLGIFFILGLLLAFSPCMLPMIPVLSGIIAGQQQLSTRKAWWLSFSYVLGMSGSYALIGALIATIGQNLQLIMQSPWIIGVYSLIFIVLAVALLNSYTFRLPTRWQTALVQTSQQHATGRYWGAALMGVFSTLILSPCVTAPLIGALSYISRSGNILLGTMALFTLGLGMGTPLLLIGTSLGKWLPKAGPWMHRVNQFFALLLLGVATLLMSRLIPTPHTLAVTTLSQAKYALAQAAQQHQPAILDFYADWCESCQSIEARVRQSPAIQAALKHVVFIHANVTRNDAHSRALMHYFNVVAPPTLIFYHANGSEYRLIGDSSTTTLLKAIESL